MAGYHRTGQPFSFTAAEGASSRRWPEDIPLDELETLWRDTATGQIIKPADEPGLHPEMLKGHERMIVTGHGLLSRHAGEGGADE